MPALKTACQQGLPRRLLSGASRYLSDFKKVKAPRAYGIKLLYFSFPASKNLIDNAICCIYCTFGY